MKALFPEYIFLLFSSAGFGLTPSPIEHECFILPSKVYFEVGIFEEVDMGMDLMYIVPLCYTVIRKVSGVYRAGHPGVRLSGQIWLAIYPVVCCCR